MTKTVKTDCCGNTEAYLIGDEYGSDRVRVEGTCPMCGAETPRGNLLHITTSSYRGQEVDLEYGPELSDTVAAIDAVADPEDGIIQAEDLVSIFRGQPTLHTTMTHYAALIAAGCKVCE